MTILQFAYSERSLMGKKRMIVFDDQLLIDMDLIFNAIREANGNWEQVEQEMRAYLEAVQNMVSSGESHQ